MRRKLLVCVFVLSLVLVVGTVSAFNGATSSSGFSGSTSNAQRYQPSFSQIYSSPGSGFANSNMIWPGLNRLESDQCNSTTSDFVIGIPPGGCTPTVVRSDLLEEQNVPVFCQLYSFQANPLIKVSSIKSISFKGDYPDGVQTVAFHPARAAVKSYKTLLGDPMINNIGYVVIVLKREQVEDNMEEWIAGNLTATLRYDAEDAYGVGKADYFLPVLSDNNWSIDYPAYSFWKGMGYLRVSKIDGNGATIQVMKNQDHSVRTVRLEEGETSSLIYMPGYYCRAGMKVKLDGLVSSDDSVLLNIDGEEIWVREGSQIIDGQCKVTSISIKDTEEKVKAAEAEKKTEEKEGDKNSDKVDFNVESAEVRIRCPGGESLLLNVSRNYDSTLKEDSGDDAKGFEDNFLNANMTVEELVENYRSELKQGGIETYGEEALLKQIELAGTVGKLRSQKALRELFIEMYPNSRAIDRMRYLVRQSEGYDYQNAYGSALVANKFRSVSLVDFKAEEGSKFVDLRINTQEYLSKKEGDDAKINSKERVEILNIVPGKVELRYVSSGKDKDQKEGPITIKEGEQGKLGGHTIYVKRIETTEVAHVSLIPEVQHTSSEADFTFKIGIEKRNIQLSPEKTNLMLKNLNESIKKWENINERLGKLIRVWKGACFATSGLLIAKNMVSGFSGQSLARQKVMTKYKSVCDTKYGGMTRTQCYNNLSKYIDRDVAAMEKALNNVNNQMDGSIDKYKTDGGLFGEGIITDQEKYKEDLRGQMGDFKHVVEVNGENVTVEPEDFQTTSQIRSAMLYKELKGSGTYAEEAAKEDFEKNVQNVAYEKQMREAAEKSVQDLGVGVDDVVLITSKKTRYFSWTGKTAGKIDLSIKEESAGKPAQVVRDGDATYLLILNRNGDKMGVSGAYKRESGEWNKDENYKNNFQNVVFYDTASKGSCSNRWPDGKASVSYYESGTRSGLPAIVPFDLTNGWYAMVPNGGGTFIDNSPQGYTQSGDVSYFKICNIGSNQLMESGSGDDLCQSFSSNTVGSVNEFLPCRGMSEKDVQELYGDARQAIREASQNHDSCTGGSSNVIRVLGESMSCGAPMSEIGGYECQDFMSPQDCKLMFNVCDPVICPPSRCDLGGRLHVSDVIQTGIVGSIFLCLPNAAEGVVVPVCVSGIHAGLESFLSILKSERDCLEYSSETGEHVGICDEITSIYKCEFFWRQMSPLMDMLVPKFVEGLYGGSSVRGGGEYMTTQYAWDNMRRSVSYFQDTYATNAFKAFKMRSVEEAGSTVCRTFVGSSFPTSADAFEELLEPESPYQFYAQFSETLFTEATVPSTSQYKVYYHIYSGNDKGVQYKIYIKNPPESSYYRSNPTVIVDSGFIPRGQTAEDSVDFTAPSGYKELCVVVDAEEHCDFKQVTTDLGIDYLTNKYTQEQAEKESITEESECISGSRSALPLANLNLQAGSEEAANPEIGLRGIVRICASRNPGEGVESSRWKDVGYCGDSNTRCWLDTDSVKDDLRTVEALENQSIKLMDERRGLIEDGAIPYDEVQDILSASRQKIENLDEDNVNEYLDEDLTKSKIGKILAELDLIVGVTGETEGSGTNQDRAEALSLKASVYQLVTQMIFRKDSSKVQTPIDARVKGCVDSKIDCGDKVCNVKTGKCEDKIEVSSVGVSGTSSEPVEWTLKSIYDALNTDSANDEIPLSKFFIGGDYSLEEDTLSLVNQDLQGVSGGVSLMVRDGFQVKVRVSTDKYNYFSEFPNAWENRNSNPVADRIKKIDGETVEFTLNEGNSIDIDIDGQNSEIDSSGEGIFKINLGVDSGTEGNEVILQNNKEKKVNSDVKIVLLEVSSVTGESSLEDVDYSTGVWATNEGNNYITYDGMDTRYSLVEESGVMGTDYFIMDDEKEFNSGSVGSVTSEGEFRINSVYENVLVNEDNSKVGDLEEYVFDGFGEVLKKNKN